MTRLGGARLDRSKEAQCTPMAPCKHRRPANSVTQSFRPKRPLEGRTGQLDTGPATPTPLQTVHQFQGRDVCPANNPLLGRGEGTCGINVSKLVLRMEH